MSVKERLSNFMKLDKLIDCKIAQYDKASKALTTEFCTDKAKAMAEEINADIDRLVDERKAIMYMVDNTPALTPDELSVLYKHYLEGMTFDAIAVKMHYARTSVFRMCKKATQKVADQWENT